MACNSNPVFLVTPILPLMSPVANSLNAWIVSPNENACTVTSQALLQPTAVQKSSEQSHGAGILKHAPFGTENTVRRNENIQPKVLPLLCPKPTKENISQQPKPVVSTKSRTIVPVFQRPVLKNPTCIIRESWPKEGEVPKEVIEEVNYLQSMFVNNKCLICGFTSKSKRTGLNYGTKHMLVHLATKPYKCDKCDKAFVNSERLLSHSIIHEDVYPFTCNICKKSFRRKKDLQLHGERMHSEVRIAPFKCTVCAKAFTSKNDVRRHMRTHTGEKTHTCTVCNQGFTKHDCLETHMNKHKGIKPYECTECHKFFFNRKYLSHHMNLHDKRNVFECKVCQTTFNFKSNLAQHMKVHSEERSHTCAVCDKTFKLPHHLRQHLSTHKASGLRHKQRRTAKDEDLSCDDITVKTE